MLTNMRPVDEREFSRLLAEATATTTPIALVGGGSKDEHRAADEHGDHRIDQGLCAASRSTSRARW